MATSQGQSSAASRISTWGVHPKLVKPIQGLVGSGGGGGGGRSTPSTPTPSASDLVGSASERAEQIEAFRSGGQGAFEAAKSRASARIAKEREQARVEAQERAEERRELIESRRLKPGEQVTPQGVFSAAPERPQGFLERIEFGIKKRKAPLQTQVLRGGISGKEKIGLAGLAFGGQLVSAGLGVKQTIFHPVKTAKGIPSAVKGIPKTAERFGETLRTSPAEATGIIGAEALIFRSPTILRKTTIKGVDIGRTATLKELPSKRIIAPEFFEGQRFPSIRKGQTAGELLKEFKPLGELGETKPAGFTAAPRPFKKVTEAGRGTSELPGVFQAPKVSPHFLRIIGEEKKIFTLKPFGETLRPSITRITPTEIRLVPGVKTTQRIIQPQQIKQTQKFFETAPKGKSFIPFIKTEKEAVIPFGTELRRTGKQAFIKFEGRRIPIAEFETVADSTILKPIISGRTITARQVSGISSRRVGRKAVFDPLSLSGVSRISRRTIPISSLTSGFGRPSRKVSSFAPVVSSFAPPTLRPSRAFSITRKPSRLVPPPSRPSPDIFVPLPEFPRKTIIGTFEFGKRKVRKFPKRKRKVKPPFRIPSLLALGTGIFAPTKATGEISGLVTRPILKPRGKKSGKKKKK